MRVEASRRLRETALIARNTGANFGSPVNVTKASRGVQSSVLLSREANLLATSGRERYASVAAMSGVRETEDGRNVAYKDVQSLTQRQREMQNGLQRITTAGNTTQDPLRLID